MQQPSLRTLVVNTCVQTAAAIEATLLNFPELFFLGSCHSAADAKVIVNATRPDLVLLDMALATGENLEMLHSVSQLVFKIVILKARLGNGTHSDAHNGNPTLRDELMAKLNHALTHLPPTVQQQSTLAREQHGDAVKQRIAIRAQNYLQVVTYMEIVYCNSQGGYTMFFLTDNRKVLSSRSLKDYEGILPRAVFVRTHQSFIVNHHFIDKLFANNYLVLKDGTQIPVAVRKKTEILKTLSLQ